ncbi:MAG: hypothetical protein LC774_10185 [Acidobacteria bacterium]|nr:hypothetical protein [Acidobacteriota bacterium]
MDEKTADQSSPAATAVGARSDNGASAGDTAPIERAPAVVDDETGVRIPVAGDAAASSYSMLEPRMKKVYGAYYKELYYTPERRVLDPKVQELISIARTCRV